MVVNEAQIPGTKIELYSTLLDTLRLSVELPHWFSLMGTAKFRGFVGKLG